MPFRKMVSLARKNFSSQVNFIHIDKTGGTAIRHALERSGTNKVIFHNHSKTLADFYEQSDEEVFFFVRDPIEKFISGFNSRKRRGFPRFNNAWTENERIAFSMFDKPNDLAEALGSEGAEFAMKNIRRVANSLAHYLISPEMIMKMRHQIIFVGEQSCLDHDFLTLKKILDLPEEVLLPSDPVVSHITPEGFDTQISDRARSNLMSWYKADFDIFKACLDLRQLILSDRARNYRSWLSGDGI